MLSALLKRWLRSASYLQSFSGFHLVQPASPRGANHTASAFTLSVWNLCDRESSFNYRILQKKGDAWANAFLWFGIFTVSLAESIFWFQTCCSAGAFLCALCISSMYQFGFLFPSSLTHRGVVSSLNSNVKELKCPNLTSKRSKDSSVCKTPLHTLLNASAHGCCFFYHL